MRVSGGLREALGPAEREPLACRTATLATSPPLAKQEQEMIAAANEVRNHLFHPSFFQANRWRCLDKFVYKCLSLLIDDTFFAGDQKKGISFVETSIKVRCRKDLRTRHLQSLIPTREQSFVFAIRDATF